MFRVKALRLLALAISIGLAGNILLFTYLNSETHHRTQRSRIGSPNSTGWLLYKTTQNYEYDFSNYDSTYEKSSDSSSSNEEKNIAPKGKDTVGKAASNTFLVPSSKVRVIPVFLKQEDNSTTERAETTTQQIVFDPLRENDLSFFSHYPLHANISDIVYRVRRGLKVAANPINEHRYKYTTRTKCSQTENVFVVYLVKTRPDSADRRHAIRVTWGNETFLPQTEIKTVFLLGKTDDPQTMSSVLQEQAEYGDIVQENFKDTYRNGSIKVTMALRWAVTHCTQAKFLVIVDDDVLLNPRNLVKLLKSPEVRNVKKLFMGRLKPGDMPVRFAQSQWYIPIKLYPFKTFPPSTTAATVIMNMEFARDFVAACPYIQLLPFDGIYTGVVAKKLGIVPRHTKLVVLGDISVQRNRVFVSSIGEYPPTRLQKQWAEMELGGAAVGMKKRMKYDPRYLNDLAFFDHYPLRVNLSDVVRGSKMNVTPINFHPYKYITKASCPVNQAVFMVLIIKTRPISAAKRAVIRQTWGNESLVANASVKHVFVLGKSDEKLQAGLRKEQKEHGDLVQENFDDVYKNTAVKTTMSFRWAVKHCSQAKYLIFLDDDVLLNPWNLVDLLRTGNVSKTRKLYMGNIKKDERPVRAKSGPYLKWYISVEDYPFDVWPTYVSAGTIIANMAFARDYAAAWPYVKHVPYDDAFISIVAKKLGVVPRGTPLVLNARANVRTLQKFVSLLGEYKPDELEIKWLEVLSMRDDPS